MNVSLVLLIHLLGGLGIYFLGIRTGESNAEHRDKRKNIYHAEGPDNIFFFMGLALIGAAIVMWTVNAHPPEQQMEHADQIRSPTTVTTPIN